MLAIELSAGPVYTLRLESLGAVLSRGNETCEDFKA
jgi:hypothetical protein